MATINSDSLVVNTSDETNFSVNAKAAKFNFREDAIESTIKLIDVGNPAVIEIGDGVNYKSNLLDSNNNVIGTKDSSTLFVRQRENGDFIANRNETIHLPGGDIFTQGLINVNKLGQLQRQKIDIIGGNGIYENARGSETVLLLSGDDPTIADITLRIR